MRVLVVNHLTLDGVLQGPGRPDEDTRDGFRHGGWAQARANDPALQQAMSERMGPGFAWLFGRRSYDDMLGHWNSVGGPMAEGLNAATKYVASSHADADLPWPHSVLVTGDVPAEVAALREQPGGNLVVMGSGRLIQTLLARDLIDELLLFVHPIVLGSGRRMFGPDDEVHAFELTGCSRTGTGLLMSTYQRRVA
jgi:dihydrofolate reductase